tara:strand:+ start:193 stop:774 length:582 start_codon:yes stop_codon:yes gene_type:complete
MSRLAFRSPTTSPVQMVSTPIKKNHYVILEATVKPVAYNDSDSIPIERQSAALTSIRGQAKDLFDMNETRKVQSGNTLLYQTTETYGTALSIEKIVEQMSSNDLTLRVNFHRPGTHSNITCMELSTLTLEKLINSSANQNGHKIAELRVKAETSTSTPRHGSMYVAISTRGTQHYLSHIDYKIIDKYDEMYHE